jgi:hypothetical protein
MKNNNLFDVLRQNLILIGSSWDFVVFNIKKYPQGKVKSGIATYKL